MSDRKDIQIPTAEEVQQLSLAAAPELQDAIPWAAYTGMRLGEMLAVDLGPVVLTAGDLPTRLEVVEQETRRQGTRKKPKNEHTRTIIVPPLAAPRPLSGRVCTLSRTQHHRLWKAARASVGLPELHWHDLRHFAATWWLERFAANGRPGVDPYAMTAIQLGHRDGGRLVRRLYGHYEEIALTEMEALVA